MFKAALFDLDGTIIDTEPQYTQFWQAIGNVYRPELPDFHRLIKGTTLDNILNTYFPEQQVRKKVVKLLDEWEENMEYPYIKGAVDFIRQLKEKGVICAIVTSSNIPKMNALRKKKKDFDDMFDFVLTAEDFQRSKPDPQCYLLASEKCGAKLNECVVFEDAINGLKAAVNAGIFTVALLTTNDENTVKDLSDYIAKDFTTLNYYLINQLLNQQ